MSLLLLAVLPVLAQKRIVHGFVKDSMNHEPVKTAVVTNENTRKSVSVGTDGSFTILVNFGDLLFFDANGYRFDTVHCNRILPDTLHVFMAQLNTLEGVTVTTTTAKYTQYQKDSIRRRENFYADIGGPRTKALANGNSGAGVGLNLDRFFKKKERAKKTAIGDFDSFEKENYINYRFNPELVSQYTGLHGDTLDTFMQKYRPEYKWLRAHLTDEDVVYYINEKLKLFFKK
ncbi:hypothetical protein [Deminuibacter soli]|uniref:Carboxypeptidase-like regulatory domain-containing protein n=1 Tax=Deminuibacter soli TaxID=2291815 RepID=A0A3E1NNH8_9BACT|nr:hypothetical protein [Deminuibacter soli]RFM29473.1 hypothetical protein DXN05_00355 [Deminuibacter soli]